MLGVLVRYYGTGSIAEGYDGVTVSQCHSVLPSPDEKDGDTGCQDNQTKYSHYHRHKVKVGILGRGRRLKIYYLYNNIEINYLKFRDHFKT